MTYLLLIRCRNEQAAKRIAPLIEGFFTGNIQIQMAGDNATQIQTSRVDELLKNEGIFFAVVVLNVRA